MKELIRPGMQGKTVWSDSLRGFLDIRNEEILSCGKKPDYLFIGDSITMHWDLELYFNPTVYKVNRGLGSDTTAVILGRSEGDVYQLDPENVIYMAGTNDLLSTVPDLWWRTDGADKETVLKTMIGNIEAFIGLNRFSKLYLSSILPANLCIPYSLYGYDELVIEANTRIRKVCRAHGIPYIDYYSALLDKDGKKIIDSLTHDGVHPNGEGYRIMAEVLTEHIPALRR